MIFRTVVLWLHLAALIAWIGGLVAIPFVVAPAIRRFIPDQGDRLVEELVRRFQRLSRELILVVLLTGIFNALTVGVLIQFEYPRGFVALLSTKIVLFIAIAANQAWYSLKLIPRGEKAKATWSAVGGVVLAGVALYLGLMLRPG